MATRSPQHGATPLDRAQAWLLGRGYRPVARALRVGRQPIDLVVTDGPQTVFVLVRTVRTRGVDGAVELVDGRTARRLVRAASRYLAEHPGVPSVRIDVVTATPRRGGDLTLEHYMNAVP